MASSNIFSDLSKLIEQMGRDKGIGREVVIDAVKEGMLTAARKKYGTYIDIEVVYHEDSGEVDLYQFKEVVGTDKFEDEEIEIILEDALKLDPETQIKDSIGIKMETVGLSRIAAHAAKQIILQKVRDAEYKIIFSEFEKRKGEIASGTVRRVDHGFIVVDMGRTEAYIPMREQIPGEVYKSGDRIQGYLLDVRQERHGPRIIMSRASEMYMMKLFEMEVPEVHEGIIEIVRAAREPGRKAKIAVRTKDPAVDPVGTCVGVKGSRVQNVVQELKGERVDIILWDEDSIRFVCNALAPSEASRAFVDEANREMEVVVPDDQLSLAIGKRGQNVRLAARLTGWKLDILSESKAMEKTERAINKIMFLPKMNKTLAQGIFQSGFDSLTSIAQADLVEMMKISGYEEEEKAKQLIKNAQQLVLEGKDIDIIDPEPEDTHGASTPQSSKEKPREKKGADRGTSQKSSHSNETKSKADKALKKAMAEIEKEEEKEEQMKVLQEEQAQSKDQEEQAQSKDQEEQAQSKDQEEQAQSKDQEQGEQNSQ